MSEKLKYPYYKDNPNLAINVVLDVRGDREYLANCRKINGVYYVKNMDLEFNGENWVKKQETIFDNETKLNVASTRGLLNGVISVSETGKETTGWFSPNPYKNCYIYSETLGQIICISYEILPKKYYTQNTNDGIFYNVQRYNSLRLDTKKIVVNNSHCSYNIEDNDQEFKRKIELHKNSEFPIDRDIRFAAPYIKEITFGAEMETINGCTPEYILNTYGIIVCKDGSIKDRNGAYPPEYVTVPLQGAKGLQTLRNASKEIGKCSDFDIKCSLHLHIGSVNPDRLFLVSLFKLCLKIQNDVFKMFPFYKTKPDGIKEKNYCKKLPSVIDSYIEGDFNKYINNVYIDIYSFLSGGSKPDINNNRRVKVNPWGEGKWNIKTRYYWINFVNLIFHKRETIEFRIHTPTLNSDKIINWLFICNAIIKYAEKYPQLCVGQTKVSFTDVLNYYRSERSNNYSYMLSENLIKYYNERCATFAKDYKAGDYISQHDINNDSKYSFNVLKIND